ncbi:creatininase family protein [Limobrevibacterium gyesilva]|uniref:Creatininase family protein n=1 Tax=Limobrevibacterium gyesilva TaxID=2991712 RepID=A0AA41YIX9_9PROT|nr:creatininase family protein [Limobrevibacterium gyesilva]MCW3474479.1 creatininase family protein [Limobrevibacterium gyesilva]
MQLALATWQEVEDYLRTSNGVIVPIGSTEQHGPNGLIGTDHLCAEVVAKGVGDAIGCAVAPTLAYGMSQHHLAFKGSATLRPSTLMLVVRDVVQSLAVHGFQRFFFINGHGGNVATVTAAFDEIYAAKSLGDPVEQVRCRMTFWSGGPRCKKVAEELYGGVNGSHATAAEVSLAQYYQPQAIKHAQMSPKVAPPSSQFFEAADYRARYPDGRIGSDPSLSSPEHGKRLYDAAIEDMVEAYRTFLAY